VVQELGDRYYRQMNNKMWALDQIMTKDWRALSWASFSITWDSYFIQAGIDISNDARTTQGAQCINFLANAMGEKLRAQYVKKNQMRREFWVYQNVYEWLKYGNWVQDKKSGFRSENRASLIKGRKENTRSVETAPATSRDIYNR
jgi:hypothetical protein